VIRTAVAVAATATVLGGAGLATAGAGAALRDTAAAAGGLALPVAGAVVSQPYGCTSLAIEPVSRVCPQGHFHSGIDLAAAAGTPVRAALAGRASVALSAGGYGLHVVLDHGGGLTTLYAHLSSVLVAGGDLVTAGQVIGEVGSTGNSTGPHLHFEIRRDGLPEDPSPELTQGITDPRHGDTPWSTASPSSATSPATPRASPPARR
jgi:murein DD-endopeptidase MepM/ murein hydrolase activator NlpD